ncbi:MAG: hypothetical protein L3J24_07960 [Xanthomonadales bacterium]|nr:hypothetical protein [Xanthomonadales bacterium]
MIPSGVISKAQAIITATGKPSAAAGITPVILAQSPDTLVIANRNPAKAADLLQQQSNPNFRSVSLKQLHDPHLPKFDLLVNATSIGHQGQHPELFPELFKPGTLLYDLNYGTAGGLNKGRRSRRLQVAEGGARRSAAVKYPDLAPSGTGGIFEASLKNGIATPLPRLRLGRAARSVIPTLMKSHTPSIRCSLW